MTTVTFTGWQGDFLTLVGTLLVAGPIQCLKESSCDIEGTIPCWWREAFPYDRELLFWRESSCIWRNRLVTWREAFRDDREWCFSRESFWVWRNHPVTRREPFSDNGGKPSPMTGNDSFGGNHPVTWRESFPDDGGKVSLMTVWTDFDYFGGNHSLLMEGSFPRWQGVIIMKGMILCLKESSCDMQGIIP